MRGTGEEKKKLDWKKVEAKEWILEAVKIKWKEK